MNKLMFGLGLCAFSCGAFSITWESEIEKIQAEGIGDAYNVIYLKDDISGSKCEKTNSQNRLTIVNEIQFSTALAALMANKKIKIMEDNNVECNAADLASVNFIQIFTDQ